MKHNPVLQKSYSFALAGVGLYRTLQARHEYVLSRQMVRAATSVGANIEEAIAAQSRKDFLSKMSIARKECRESSYWFRLLRDSEIASSDDVAPLLEQGDELIRLLTSIIISTERDPQASAPRVTSNS